MKKLILLLGIGVSALTGTAQQLFQQTQFMVNPYTLNPALAGSKDYVDIKAGYRSQWLGFQESDGYTTGPDAIVDGYNTVAPRTTYLSAHAAIGHDHGYYKDPRNENKAFHGVGGFVVNDQLGLFKTTSLYGSYSYNMLLFKANKQNTQMYGFNGQERNFGVRMVMGAHIGVVNHVIDRQGFVDFSRIAGPSFTNTTDQALLTPNGPSELRRWSPDASLGVWIYSNSFYAGASMRRILANDLNYTDANFEYNFARNFNMMGGYKWFVSQFILLEPSLNIKMEGELDGIRSSVDVNMLVAYDNTYTNGRGSRNHRNMDLHLYTGMTYRHGAALAVLLGAVIEKKYEFAYSFDIATTALNAYQSGTHEVTVGYRLMPKSKFHIAEEHW